MDFLTAIKRWGVMVILLFLVVESFGKVSDRKCTNGGGECDSIKHAYCCVCCSICVCGPGYGEHLVDGLSCELVVSARNCSVGGTECDAIDNAKCNDSKLKCECTEGYSENVNTCVVSKANISTTATSGIGVLVLAMMTAVVHSLSHV